MNELQNLLCAEGQDIDWFRVWLLASDLDLSKDAECGMRFMQSRRLSLVMGMPNGIEPYGVEFRMAYPTREAYLQSRCCDLKRNSYPCSIVYFLDMLGKAIREDFPDFEGPHHDAR